MILHLLHSCIYSLLLLSLFKCIQWKKIITNFMHGLIDDNNSNIQYMWWLCSKIKCEWMNTKIVSEYILWHVQLLFYHCKFCLHWSSQWPVCVWVSIALLTLICTGILLCLKKSLGRGTWIPRIWWVNEGSSHTNRWAYC